MIKKFIKKNYFRFFKKSGRTQAENDRDPARVYVISFPKSGRTWLRMLIGKILCDRYSLDETQMLDTISLTAKAGVLPVNFIHDGSEYIEASTFFRFNPDKSMFCDKKVIFLCREPKDILVSSYFQATRRIPQYSKFKGTISKFIRHPQYGAKKLISFYKLWDKNRAVPKEFLLISYEEMHRDPHKILRKVLDFIEAKNISNSVIKNAIQFAKFENMKNMEKENKFNNPILQSTDPQDNDSYKVRQGKVGGYRDRLSQEDIDYIDRTVAQLSCPFYSTNKN